MEWLQALLPYMDSMSIILVLGIVAIWGLFNRKDAQLLGRLEAEIKQLRKELDQEKVKIDHCTHERAVQEIKDALQSKEIEDLKKRCQELEHENQNLKSMFDRFGLKEAVH